MKKLMKDVLVSKKNRKASKLTKKAIKLTEGVYSYWMN